MPKFPVLRKVIHDGEEYLADAEIELEEKAAEPLLAVGAIGEAIEAKAAQQKAAQQKAAQQKAPQANAPTAKATS